MKDYPSRTHYIKFFTVDIGHRLFPVGEENIDLFYKNNSYLKDCIYYSLALERISWQLYNQKSLAHDIHYFLGPSKFKTEIPVEGDFYDAVCKIIDDRSEKCNRVISHESIAKEFLGISKSMFSRFLHNKYPMSAHIFMRLCIYLRVDVDEFNVLYKRYRGCAISKCDPADVVFRGMVASGSLCKVIGKDGMVHIDKRPSKQRFDRLFEVFKERVVAQCIFRNLPYDDFLNIFGPLENAPADLVDKSNSYCDYGPLSDDDPLGKQCLCYGI